MLDKLQQLCLERAALAAEHGASFGLIEAASLRQDTQAVRDLRVKAHAHLDKLIDAIYLQQSELRRQMGDT